MSGGSITLHPEFGVNPSLDVCFWCGEPRGVALLGRNKGREAPRQVVTSYDPCDACRGEMERGVALVEVEAANPSRPRPELQPGVVPSGRWIVVRPEALDDLFQPELASRIRESGKAFVERELFDRLLPEDQKAEESAT